MMISWFSQYDLWKDYDEEIEKVIQSIQAAGRAGRVVIEYNLCTPRHRRILRGNRKGWGGLHGI
jgi:hypothetical protein